MDVNRRGVDDSEYQRSADVATLGLEISRSTVSAT